MKQDRSSSQLQYSAGADIVTVASVTHLTAGDRGKVAVAGSHAGIIAAALAAAAGARAVVLNDAGVGLDRAGIAGLTYLDAVGMAGATVDAWTARIADGADQLARGVISYTNAAAAALGVHRGMSARAAAHLLAQAPLPTLAPPPLAEAAHLIARRPGQPDIWGLDTVSLAGPAHDGSIVVAGSHGGVLGGNPERALKCRAIAAVFNDAGIGIDDAGISRLPALDTRGVAAAAVDAATAHIGEALSTWETGRLSRVNACAERRGARPGMSVKEFSALFSTPDFDQ